MARNEYCLSFNPYCRHRRRRRLRYRSQWTESQSKKGWKTNDERRTTNDKRRTTNDERPKEDWRIFSLHLLLRFLPPFLSLVFLSPFLLLPSSYWFYPVSILFFASITTFAIPFSYFVSRLPSWWSSSSSSSHRINTGSSSSFFSLRDQVTFYSPGHCVGQPIHNRFALLLSFFLDGSTHLYMRECPSVGPSVRPFVRRSVRRMVTCYFRLIEMAKSLNENHWADQL